jgi:hypothetical protein
MAIPEPSGKSPRVFEIELRELESRFEQIKLLASSKTRRYAYQPGKLYKQSNSSSGNPPLSSRYSLRETPGEKPEGSKVARFVWAALELSGFSPGVSQREIRELKARVFGTRFTLSMVDTHNESNDSKSMCTLIHKVQY